MRAATGSARPELVEGRNADLGFGMRQIAHLDLDNFFVAVERAADARLRDRPVIVGGPRDGRGPVAAASPEARATGVRCGMTLADAARKCPDAAFVSGSFVRYLQAAATVDRIIRRRCTRIEWVSIDEAFVDLSPSAPALGHAARVAEQIQQDVRSELSLDVSIGIGRSKTVARIASGLARPKGLLYVMPGYEARFLAPLRLALLPGLPDAALRHLRDARVTTIGGLAQLDAARAIDALGPKATAWQRRAAAEDDAPVIARRLPPVPAPRSRQLPLFASKKTPGVISRRLFG